MNESFRMEEVIVVDAMLRGLPPTLGDALRVWHRSVEAWQFSQKGIIFTRPGLTH
ncbi:hypothetical protein LC613_35440 [Nostoc sphaeroides CHAB 2801]|uniref:hypothetical protein n=1 Tax=Nostoc sphaeroides TaxID=446679 RepID=UPI001E330A1C|nr:hypothetical protein [Nostoc sphaeroides]MCC5632844.1 hypothetical protein [Nostoc sphaeroides CHAB 2801]